MLVINLVFYVFVCLFEGVCSSVEVSFVWLFGDGDFGFVENICLVWCFWVEGFYEGEYVGGVRFVEFVINIGEL